MEDKTESKEFLYRIMTTKRVKELFETNNIVFLKPAAWKDPFENYLSKVQFIDNNGTVSKIDYLQKVYGQCYSIGKETSLMWDAYTPNGDGIRIKIDKEKFIEYLKKQNQYPSKNFSFDKVTYVRYGDFISKLRDDKELIKLYKNPNEKLLKMFFEKRIEYKDEREFRIMYNSNGDEKNYGNTLKINIDPIDLIHSIRLDPKMKEEDCKELKKYFIKKGMKGNKILRSLLYKYQVTKRVRMNI